MHTEALSELFSVATFHLRWDPLIAEDDLDYLFSSPQMLDNVWPHIEHFRIDDVGSLQTYYRYGPKRLYNMTINYFLNLVFRLNEHGKLRTMKIRYRGLPPGLFDEIDDLYYHSIFTVDDLLEPFVSLRAKERVKYMYSHCECKHEDVKKLPTFGVSKMTRRALRMTLAPEVNIVDRVWVEADQQQEWHFDTWELHDIDETSNLKLLKGLKYGDVIRSKTSQKKILGLEGKSWDDEFAPGYWESDEENDGESDGEIDGESDWESDGESD
ncbi:hypothetical protein K402DRAFT_395838 [Aulographum hederae CBS 113979]|uniref:Uncharacterized protein n=1 Tax=Aulographum hederae CBS 113979 TaxID=1176131 RepID=A0A6G1GTN5_9PEZI|nr:hypothetical protein K402DRAFT_395838 [Aulographum hederae CBS 113979]